MKIAFVLNDLRLSGGVNTVLQYASRIASRNTDEVALLLRETTTERWFEPLVPNLTMVPQASWHEEKYDIAIATYWETLLLLGDVNARSYLWFCQSYEDRFFPDRNPSISSMQLAGSIPIPVITEARWIQNLIISENPDRSVRLVRNGIDKEVFKGGYDDSQRGEDFSVLVEGPLDNSIKNTGFAINACLKSKYASSITHVGDKPFPTHDPRYLFVQNGLSFQQMADLYRSHHLQVKTPLVEGMFGPPLEGFHSGLPAIVTPVTGAEEYIKDGVNSLVILWDDTPALTRAIDRLAKDRELWRKLQNGAIKTATRWPDWDTQATEFRAALFELAQESKLTQSDLGNLGRTIQMADMLHWLAMRRLSDKTRGSRVIEELAYHAVSSQDSFMERFRRKLKSLDLRP